MHKRVDYLEQDLHQQHYLISGGLDQVWVKAEPIKLQSAAERKLVFV